MNRIILTRVGYYLARFVQLQLFVTLISLPILLAWGLPLSVLSPIGNLIFTPVLTLFLLLSSLIFFLELVHLPNTWLIWCLEQVTTWWLKVLSFASPQCMIGFCKPSLIFLLGLPLLTCVTMMLRPINTLIRSIAALSILFLGSCLYLHILVAPITNVTHLPFGKGTITVVIHHKKVLVIDPGVLAQRSNAPSWLEYTLQQHLVQTAGITHIDHLVLLQPSARVFDAVAQLCDKITIKNIYCPFWQGTLPGSGNRSWWKLKTAAQNHNTHLVRLRNHQTITLAKDTFTITAGQPIKKGEITFPTFTIEGQVDVNPLFLQSTAKNAPAP